MIDRYFIVLEGIDGSGKTTQAFKLEKWLKKRGVKVYTTREPTDGIIGGIIRAALSTKLRISQRTLQILFAADRSEHVREIEVRMSHGYTVISDRYILSSIAYGMTELDMKWLYTMNSVFPKPDITIILDLPADLALRRVGPRFTKSLFEKKELLEEVRNNFLRLHETYSEAFNTVVVDAGKSEDEVHKSITTIIEEKLLK